jgi:hypothetical protein
VGEFMAEIVGAGFDAATKPRWVLRRYYGSAQATVLPGCCKGTLVLVAV